MNCAIFVGRVRHRRTSPVAHEFQYGMFMLYLDLAELPTTFDPFWLWSARRPAPAWFRRADYLGDVLRPLDESVRDLVQQRTGRRPTGPIRLLTHLRYFGYLQNPVSFYYCFEPDGETLDTIVAEVTNTPWKERHAYVIPSTRGGSRHRHLMSKVSHVSPFMPMEQSYDWRFTTPGRHLAVHMETFAEGDRVLDVTLLMERRPLDSRELARCLSRYPFMTASVVGGIYGQALRLWFKGAPFHSHPLTKRTDGSVLPAR